MPFVFLNNANIDRNARKLIRSHVAKGRNVGKKLPSRRKHGKPDVRIVAPIGRPSAIADAKDCESGEAIPTIERQIGDGLSVLSFPVEVTPASRGLLQRAITFIKDGPLYPPELRHAIDFEGCGSHMIQYIFLDEACFHCTVAMSLAAVSPILLTRHDSIEAMRHLSHTFRLVNEKLSGDEALSDTTMAVVIVMTQYERLRGQHRQGLVHLEGLHQMVEMRGGISEIIKNNPFLAQKIFRADLDFALQLGLETRFSVEDMPSYETISWLCSRFNQGQTHQYCNSQVVRQLSTDLQDALVDITALASLLNNIPGCEAKLDSHTFHDVLILIAYRLIHIMPLNNLRSASGLENALHLSLVAFITSFFRSIGGKLPVFPLLSRLARSAAEGRLEEDVETQEIFLWTLFIGRATIFSQQDDVWLAPRIAGITRALDFCTWEAVHKALSKFPWVNALYNKSGQALWDKSKSPYDTPAESPGNLLPSIIQSC